MLATIEFETSVWYFVGGGGRPSFTLDVGEPFVARGVSKEAGDVGVRNVACVGPLEPLHSQVGGVMWGPSVESGHY